MAALEHKIGDIVSTPDVTGTIVKFYKSGRLKLEVKEDEFVKIYPDDIVNKNFTQKNETTLNICPEPIYDIKEFNGNFMILNTKLAKGDNMEIIQVAYKIYDTDFKLVKSVNYLINENIGKVDYHSHFTLKQIQDEGKTPQEVFIELSKDLETVSCLIGHSIKFHVDALKKYFRKLKLNFPVTNPLCTMKTTIDYCELYNNKFPKLGELYQKCFSRELDETTILNAAESVNVTFKCFKYLCGK